MSSTTDVKLCDADFDSIHWGKDDVGPERFVVTIDGKSEENCNEIKQQILNNQAIVEDIQETIEMYESLNRRHQESYEDSKDSSYLNTINKNSDIISELESILKTTFHSKREEENNEV